MIDRVLTTEELESLGFTKKEITAFSQPITKGKLLLFLENIQKDSDLVREKKEKKIIPEPSEPFQRVSELEWYLSLESMQKMIDTAGGGKSHRNMDLDVFHDFWMNIELPSPIHPGIYQVKAPFDIGLFLSPYGDFSIPLGFYAAGKEFHAVQDTVQLTDVSVSLQCIGDGAKGYALRIVNLRNEGNLCRIKKGDILFSGCFVKEQGTKPISRLLFSNNPPTRQMTSDIALLHPSLFLKENSVDAMSFYISGAREQTLFPEDEWEFVFYIQKQMDNMPHPLTDPIIETIRESDTTKYIRSSKKWEDIWLRVMNPHLCDFGDVIPQKRYYLFSFSTEWITAYRE